VRRIRGSGGAANRNARGYQRGAWPRDALPSSSTRVSCFNGGYAERTQDRREAFDERKWEWCEGDAQVRVALKGLFEDFADYGRGALRGAAGRVDTIRAIGLDVQVG